MTKKFLFFFSYMYACLEIKKNKYIHVWIYAEHFLGIHLWTCIKNKNIIFIIYDKYHKCTYLSVHTWKILNSDSKYATLFKPGTLFNIPREMLSKYIEKKLYTECSWKNVAEVVLCSFCENIWNVSGNIFINMWKNMNCRYFTWNFKNIWVFFLNVNNVAYFESIKTKNSAK